MGRLLAFFIISLFSVGVNAQSGNIFLNITVTNDNNKALQNASIIVDQKIFSTTNEDGKSKVALPSYTQKITIKHALYLPKTVTVFVGMPKNINVQLSSDHKIDEVIVTAKEGKGLTSKSIINQKAMEHLQPSSFADLMELLPGGLARNPNLTTTNRTIIRENTDGPSSYNTSSLGVQFMIDDNVWNTNADMQVSSSDTQFLDGPRKRATAGIGVDMRTLSTNDIEKVEIIRGIPSAAYGDLTSGVIKVERKIGYSNLQARFKADGFSKQYYVSKGFNLNKNWQLSASADLLDAKQNPTDDFENYQRITASIRSKLKTKLWNNPLEWRSNIDLSNNIDKIKNDPDNGYPSIDFYKSSNNRLSLTNNFIYQLKKDNFFNKVILNTAIRQGFEKIEQVKLMQQSGPRSISTATTQGENIGIFPALRYVSEFATDGKPLDLSALFQLNGTKKVAGLTHQYEAGLDWRYSKNNGKGQQYDMLTPPTATMTTRPRAYSDIPAYQNLASFIGDQISYNINGHQLNLYAGLRASKLLGMDASYSISKKVFLEPRVNFQYSLPNIMVLGHPLKTDFTMGYGLFYKQPTLLMLYPNQRYTDYTQLNYYHNDERYRYVNYMTYVQNVENKNLTAAKNTKHEIRVDLSYRNHEFFATFFQEDMDNGFRNVLRHDIHTFKKYNAAFVDTNDWNNGPNLANVPYEIQSEFGSYTMTENGSATLKKGIEFGYSSPRFSSINTKFTLTGAWFKTQYRNTVPVIEKPNISLAGNNFPYYGIYKNDDGYVNSNLNYNFFVDTYLPSLDMNISASFQGVIFNNRAKDQRTPEPISYYGIDGVVHQFSDADRTDLYKQWLVRDVSVTDNLATNLTYTISANLKISKRIYKSLKTSMFVNRLFNYAHPYNFNGVRVTRKNSATPYFGMELNYNF